jgi:hypothetical protein
MTARTGKPEQGKQTWASRTGLPLQDCLLLLTQICKLNEKGEFRFTHALFMTLAFPPAEWL